MLSHKIEFELIRFIPNRYLMEKYKSHIVALVVLVRALLDSKMDGWIDR